MEVSKCMGVQEHRGAYGHHPSQTTPMTASKVGTSYLKLTIPLHVLPSYFKNRTGPCCDRYEDGLFTAANTLVVRVRSVYAAHWSSQKLSLITKRQIPVLQAWNTM